MKCQRCNRSKLPTAEHSLKEAVPQRLCNNCAGITRNAHGADNLKKIKGTDDEGLSDEAQPSDGSEGDSAPRATSTESTRRED